MSEKERIDIHRIPEHIAIIMDGNGRWAKRKGLNRCLGHQAGAETVHKITEEAARLGVKFLTLYTFSTENWNRPTEEVSALMDLLFNQLEEDTFMNNNICFRVIGDICKLPEKVQHRVHACITQTASNTGMCLVLALSYSSRWEILEAAKKMVCEVQTGQLSIEDIDDNCFSRHLTTSFMPDPDLFIRTGGELRISNFLMWQCAYTELYFCDVFWPDFNEKELHKAIHNYQKRERRFGKISEQL